MKTKSHSVTDFSVGFITGALGVLILASILLYTLNRSQLVTIPALELSPVRHVLAWTYANLRLSIIPFSLTFLLFSCSLLRLKRLLRDQSAAVEEIAQLDHLVDIWINLFFGIGVIWTAVGMRGALLEGLGDLDAQSAAKLGAFSILQRLVDGGILLALSTTIFGAVGGYLLRLVKSLTVGPQVIAYYNRMAEQQADCASAALKSIDTRLSQLVSGTARQTPDGSPENLPNR
jgi:hypothetical protein